MNFQMFDKEFSTLFFPLLSFYHKIVVKTNATLMLHWGNIFCFSWLCHAMRSQTRDYRGCYETKNKRESENLMPGSMALLFDHVINSNLKPRWWSKTIKTYIYAILHEIQSLVVREPRYCICHAINSMVAFLRSYTQLTFLIPCNFPHSRLGSFMKTVDGSFIHKYSEILFSAIS